MNINELSDPRPVTRVLITGGAGSVGLEVIKELHQNKKWYRVKILERKTPGVIRKLRPYRKDFEIILGDLCNEDILEKAAADVDFVIHLAAVIPPMADRNPDLAERTNVNGTRMLVQALERKSPSAFFLYTSSISVYGDRVYNPWITVNDPLLPSDGDEYARTKIKAEKIVKKSRLRWSILRLSAIMGPQTRLDPLFFHMPLDTSLEIATARDAGFALVEAIYHRRELSGKTFNLSGGEKCRTTYREFLRNVFKVLGLEKLNLPETAFAQRNFHCGIYADATNLEEILHFQQDTLDDYFQLLAARSTFLSRTFFSIFPVVIKLFLLNKSEPQRARNKNNKSQLNRFFYAEQAGSC